MQSFLKLTEATKRQFNDKTNELFSQLDYDSNKLYVKGSYIIPVLGIWAGDIDLYEPVDMKDFNTFYEHLRLTLEKMEADIEYIEIHEQFKGTPAQFLRLNVDTVQRMLKDGEGRIQMEMSFFDDGLIKNVSIMYDLKHRENVKVNKVISDLFAVIETKLNKSIFKALKRVYTMLVLMPDTKSRKEILQKIIKILSNSEYGSLYLAITYLTAVNDTRLFNKTKKSEALQNIKEVVRKTGHLSKTMETYFEGFKKNNVKKLISNLRSILNFLIGQDPNFQKL